MKTKEQNKNKWERIGKYEKFDNSEGTFCTFYNDATDTTKHVWNKPDGSVKLLDENMCYEYDDQHTTDNDQELQEIHKFKLIS